MKDLAQYALKLNETIEQDNLIITRVPGGWIYEIHSMATGRVAVFVPFNNEFQHLKADRPTPLPVSSNGR